MILKSLALAASCILLSHCAGYTLGGNRPEQLVGVQSIAVPLAQNDTLTPRADVLTTNSVVDALTRDGSYKIRKTESADTILKITLKSIRFGQLRSARTDTLQPEELDMKVLLKWKLMSGATVLTEGTTIGRSRFFVANNLQRARDNALPDALRRAAESLTARLADGY